MTQKCPKTKFLAAETGVLVALIMSCGLVTPVFAQATTNAAPDASATQLPEVVVTAEGAPLEGREVDSTALKMPATLHETPRSVSIINEDRIREQNFQRLEDTFRYVPGVFNFGPNGDSYHFYSRGFNMGPDETKLDNFAGYLVNGSFSPSLFAVERIVYLRGPAGLQYGAAPTPGGLINMITKRPQPTQYTRIETLFSTYAGQGIGFGENNSYGANFDTTGPLTKDGKVLYRVAGEAKNLGTYTDHILDHNRGILADMTFLLGEDDRFSVTPIFQYDRQEFGAGRALVISPSTSLSTSDGITGPINTGDLTSVENNLSAGGREIEHWIAGFDFNAAFTPQWRAILAYRFMEVDTINNQFTPQANTLTHVNPADPRAWTIQRRQSKSVVDRQNHGIDFQTSYEIEPADWVKNLTALGFNGRFFSTSVNRAAATQPNQSPINIYTGQPVTPLVDPNPPLLNSFLNNDFYWNTYLQNQSSFLDDMFVLTLGLGYGEQYFGRDYSNSATPAPSNVDEITKPRRGDVTPNAALVYNITKKLAVYGSYSTSFQPADNSQEDINGETGNFDPTTGVNYEIGTKYDFKRVSLGLSLFITKLDNVLVQSDPGVLNPNGNQFFTQTGGGRRTRGIELSTELRLTDEWSIYGTGSFLDSIYRGEGRIPGSETEKTPRWAFSIFNRYQFLQGPLKGLGANLGIIWQDDRWSAARTTTAPDPLLLPAYWRVDAGINYTIKHWDFALNVENLLDKRYFMAGSTGANLEIGAPRTFAFRAAYSF